MLIFAAGVILLGGIGFAIVGDARERTRKFSHHTGEEVAAGVPHKHSQQAKQRARAKARAGARAAAQEPLAQGSYQHPRGRVAARRKTARAALDTASSRESGPGAPPAQRR